MKILLTGSHGILGSEIYKVFNQRNNSNIFNRDFVEVVTFLRKFDGDLSNFEDLNNWFIHNHDHFDICIHCAGYKENIKRQLFKNNILATTNLVQMGFQKRFDRLVYISTDYIYDVRNDRNLYNNIYPNSESAFYPFNEYAWSKLGGECAVRTLDNYLIIRTSFLSDPPHFDEVFEDCCTSKDWVDKIAKEIVNLSLSKKQGIINLGKKNGTTLENLVHERYPNMKTKQPPEDYPKFTLMKIE